MARSKCPACSSTRFEQVEVDVPGSKTKKCFVQCAECGAVVSVIPRRSTNSLIDDLQKDINKIKEKLGL